MPRDPFDTTQPGWVRRKPGWEGPGRPHNKGTLDQLKRENEELKRKAAEHDAARAELDDRMRALEAAILGEKS